MPKITHRLSALTVRSLKAAGLHPDGDGLYLKVTSGGSKSWVFRYMLGGRARYLGLGSAASVELGKARELAAKARELVRQGIDPIEHRQQERAQTKLAEARGMTFRQCAEAWIASHEAGWRNARHRQQWPNTLATYVYPTFGDLPVGAVDTDLVLKVLEPIWATRTETASRVRGRIEAVLSWAKAKRVREGENPAQWRGHLDHFLPARARVRRVEHHPALPYAEIPAVMARLRECDDTSARALEFIVLTASRSGEALGARFAEIDLEARLWTVPPSRMKGGREHRVPLSPRAVAIVREMSEIRLNEFSLHEIRPTAVRHGTVDGASPLAPRCNHAWVSKQLQRLGKRVDELPGLRLRGGAGARLGRQGASRLRAF